MITRLTISDQHDYSQEVSLKKILLKLKGLVNIKEVLMNSKLCFFFY